MGFLIKKYSNLKKNFKCGNLQIIYKSMIPFETSIKDNFKIKPKFFQNINFNLILFLFLPIIYLKIFFKLLYFKNHFLKL